MESQLPTINNARIFTVRSEKVCKLVGFEKHHQIPNSVNPRVLIWVDQLTSNELNKDLQEVVAGLRANFNFKRRHMDIHGPEDRRGVIETPFFNYEVSVDLDRDDPSLITWRREINHIRDVDQLVSPAFLNCFAKAHWRLEVVFADEFNLADIIDRIEDLESPDIQVDYDKDLKWCEVALSNTKARLNISKDTVQIFREVALAPRELVDALFDFQSQLFKQIEAPGIGQQAHVSDDG